MKIVLDPIAHDSAVKMIADKPALLRKQFDRLLPELQARAFTVTWIEDANVLRSIRDAIAELPQGGDWAKLREQIADELMQSGTYFDEEKSTKRAELLLRTHGFQAYQATAWQVAQETIEDFPYLQYMTMEDEAVRDAHRALNGIVLPANHPFWEDHYPPWDWGCRCQVRQISRAEYERIQGLDAGRPAEQRMILSGARLKKLEGEGVIALGPNQMIDVRSPKNRFAELQAAGNAPAIPYAWHPSTLRIPIERLKEAYADHPEAWAHFEKYAKETTLDDGNSLLEWLGGDVDDTKKPVQQSFSKKAQPHKSLVERSGVQPGTEGYPTYSSGSPMIKYRGRNTGMVGKVSLPHGMAPDVKDRIIDVTSGMNDEFARIGIPGLRGITSVSRDHYANMGDGILGVRADFGRAKFQKTTWIPGDAPEMKPDFSRSYYDEEKQVLVDVWHEGAHHIHQMYRVKDAKTYMDPPLEKALEKMFIKAGRGKYSATTYAQKNEKEWFAENYTLWKNGRKDLVDKGGHLVFLFKRLDREN